MNFTDLTLEELEDYRPDLPEPGGLDAFWNSTIAEARAAGGEVVRTPLDGPIAELVIEDLVFPGFAGDPVRGWVIRPKDAAPRAAVVQFIGYGGGRGLPGEHLGWASAGYVHVVMDTRGQGSGWGGGGGTADPHGSGPAAAGYLTRGIESPETYYYRRVYTDAVRLLDAVAAFPEVDASRIAVTGVSQGGGISIAAAALSSHVAAVMPDVPFLCDFPRSTTRTPLPPFTEVTKYLSVHRDRVADVLATLSYFDGAVLASRISAPALFSVALMDDVVLPSSVFAAYHRLASTDREIEVYAHNGHEGGGPFQWLRQTSWLADRFGAPLA
ncbi:prolyl oligopeptidase family serine peptidase [Agromyces sp. MMS17-SY077]|uniref:Prolyl oligopeptidase family serine peptidase n=1 Tax=Agromyces seonyuensis TaxID=2662446 RepID=A0A6I4P533_9MICO|nr:acetylxylan esterase [Agromyces seonyuensis]MWB99499.1 prolyl oligopeptidase family serine peptidase [Agromyces seonyuensis]